MLRVLAVYSRRTLAFIAGLVAGVLLIAAVPSMAKAQTVPPLAARLRPDLVRSAHMVLGINAPIPLLAAQIQQESAWNPNARSAYAAGLTQFTPDTERWIIGVYGASIGAQGTTDPRWSIRAQVAYMNHLVKQLGGATECDAWQFALSGYNGGAGWVMRDRTLAQRNGANPLVYASVAPFNAGRGLAFFRENRHYPVAIVAGQKRYADWGRTLCNI